LNKAVRNEDVALRLPAMGESMSDSKSADYSLAFSHVGFFVTDMDKMADFYSNVLGFFITDKGVLNGRRITFFSRDPREHHQVVLVGGQDPAVKQNINQISFRVQSLGELKNLYHCLVAADTKGLDPVIHGNSWSIYFHDPEGNRIEVFADTDWYILQPFKEPLDLTRSEQEIREFTRTYCEKREGFQSIAKWRQKMRKLMAPVKPKPETIDSD
jgi:catechol 2,3-dioxygenase-like lactoylglutathione lyase family enzyme